MTLSGISPLQESLREGIGGALPAGRQGILPLGKRTAGPFRRVWVGGAKEETLRRGRVPNNFAANKKPLDTNPGLFICLSISELTLMMGHFALQLRKPAGGMFPAAQPESKAASQR